MAGARAALGHDPVILMSSWSPPPSSERRDLRGRHPGQTAGAYRYADFGAWWRSSLDAHAAAGVVPTWSASRRPDFVPTGRTTWSACLFDASEDPTRNAGYGPALQAVAEAVADLSPRPLLIGPEVSGIAGNRVRSYLDALDAGGVLDQLDGIAHHLYNGGTASLPASFAGGMAAIAGDARGKPLFQTEFGPSPVDMFNVAWLIQNAVTVEGVAYLPGSQWGRQFASATQGLVSLEAPAPARCNASG